MRQPREGAPFHECTLAKMHTYDVRCSWCSNMHEPDDSGYHLDAMLRTVDFRENVPRRDTASDAKLLHGEAEDPV